MIHRYDHYRLFWCFSHILGVGYGGEFCDIKDGVSSLGQGIFKLLVNIKPSYLVYHCGDICYLEPYVPSNFV